MKAVRTRRLAATSLIAVLALTGCARNPDVAVRLGELSVSNADIQAMAAPVVAQLESDGYTNVTGAVEQSIVKLEAVREVARRYAQEKGVTVPPPDFTGVDANEPYVRLQAEAWSYLNALQAAAAPRRPTEDEMQRIYDRFIELAGEGAATYEQLGADLLEMPDYHRWLSVRDELTAAADRYGLTVNPLYQPLELELFTLAQGQIVMVTLPLGEQGTGAAAPAN